MLVFLWFRCAVCQKLTNEQFTSHNYRSGDLVVDEYIKVPQQNGSEPIRYQLVTVLNYFGVHFSIVSLADRKGSKWVHLNDGYRIDGTFGKFKRLMEEHGVTFLYVLNPKPVRQKIMYCY